MKIYKVYNKYGLKPTISGDVGDGWAPVLDQLFAEMINLGWDKELHQVKEKFGGLRVYIGDATDEVYDAIRRAEVLCATRCETCGEPGDTLGSVGWIRVACANHKR